MTSLGCQAEFVQRCALWLTTKFLAACHRSPIRFIVFRVQLWGLWLSRQHPENAPTASHQSLFLNWFVWTGTLPQCHFRCLITRLPPLKFYGLNGKKITMRKRRWVQNSKESKFQVVVSGSTNEIHHVLDTVWAEIVRGRCFHQISTRQVWTISYCFNSTVRLHPCH